MAKLSIDDRDKLSERKFAVPEKRAYPIEDKAHAANAKARAAQQRKAGNLTADEERRIDANANKVLEK
ncbi:hypothetical protein [Aestuariivirga sp.]|uniref:hypothetical protein n=1 Tax=Aestuariivirga sp. TaxID=2650926 RepID=UPI0039E29975